MSSEEILFHLGETFFTNLRKYPEDYVIDARRITNAKVGLRVSVEYHQYHGSKVPKFNFEFTFDGEHAAKWFSLVELTERPASSNSSSYYQPRFRKTMIAGITAGIIMTISKSSQPGSIRGEVRLEEATYCQQLEDCLKDSLRTMRYDLENEMMKKINRLGL